MSDTPDPQTNPHTGRSRSSTLSGAFGPITPNPSRGMQHHERRPSFLGSLLGLKLSAQPDAFSPGATPAAGDKWSPASSVAETDEGAVSTVPTTVPITADMKSTGDGSRAAHQSLSASLGALGSWSRAATWMAEKTKEDVTSTGVAPLVPTSPIISGSGQYVGGTTLGRRMSTSQAFRRPFEMPSYTPVSQNAEDSLVPLSRVVSAPSTTEWKDTASLPPVEPGGQDRGRTWWGSPKSKPKRKLSPMGERMIRDSMFH